MKQTMMRRYFWIALLLVAILGSGYSLSPAQDLQKGSAGQQEIQVETALEQRPIKTIGIIGGISWASSIEYYRIMNELVRDRLGGVSSAQILMYSIEFGEFSKQERLADKGDWTLMTKTIVDAAQRLKRGGADFIVIASNTINSLADTVEQQVGLPVLHIADATGAAVRKRGLHTVALLGTKYTMEQPFYRERLQKYGIKVVIPNEKERDYINAVIFDELCANRIKNESREGYIKIIERLQKEEGAEGVILGCTEIPLLIKQDDVAIPVFDTTAIHSEAAVDYSLLISPGVAGAQNYRNCAWPIEISPEGIGNWLGPESLARYWLMPFEEQDEAMTINGMYPNARYFSFVAYNSDKGAPTDVAGGVYDATIAPDPDTINPFVKPGVGDGTYTVVISRTGENSGNTIRVDSDFAWVLMRLYVPAPDPPLSGESLTGSVPLPTIFLTRNGATKELQQCSTVNKLADIREAYQKFFPPGLDLIGDEGIPSSDRLWFGAPRVTPPILLPNPNNKYIAMFPGNEYQPGRIIVIHGKAPGFPDTYDGTPIWEPARTFRKVDTRFWSVCNTDLALPLGTVGCKSDMTTDLEGGFYTLVISDDPLRPDWLRPNINWLPWGDKGYLKLVFFRNMLPSPDFRFAIQNAIAAGCTFEFNLPVLPPRDDVDGAGQCAQEVMGDYYPVAVWCDKSTFMHGGWKACIDGL